MTALHVSSHPSLKFGPQLAQALACVGKLIARSSACGVLPDYIVKLQGCSWFASSSSSGEPWGLVCNWQTLKASPIEQRCFDRAALGIMLNHSRREMAAYSQLGLSSRSALDKRPGNIYISILSFQPSWPNARPTYSVFRNRDIYRPFTLICRVSHNSAMELTGFIVCCKEENAFPFQSHLTFVCATIEVANLSRVILSMLSSFLVQLIIQIVTYIQTTMQRRCGQLLGSAKKFSRSRSPVNM
ncbi:hypothetical protein BT96DRAFT_340793 [Gymnopus androsaceus JB14]|uniref:Uncharacterized protein n=1 Tax=Gymnopus androsaceus JB14 TaxID=1447944 RepID=A0A6A4H074_9AGAR|nr:hypothetical protein BT96DRAFT_340793 [Gymnopus androsaceus JB14]